MRKIDEAKKERIKQAVFEITRDEGIAALSFGKIAKLACVSSGTPYVYYRDKTVMLSQIYLDVKVLFDEGLQAAITAGKTPQDKLFNAANHFASQFLEHPLEANYLSAVRNNPKLITPTAIREGNRQAQPLYRLFQELVDAGVLITNNQETVSALVFAPFTMVLQERFVMDQPVLLSELQTVIQLSLQSVLKSR
ncbi:TetR/AcrR family transcriptional regulator [Levilactobacillus fujinensis]|uniref:TetR/AcrR family transcriptional regulator n=1 Tax=Levilactobacillus fujinensis TaxID=2486024 RepID=A0ABW1TE57_9LACO|nr:TetR/AcrR family transcriptional regulator [Levilactobacillus fujinensis]